MSAKAQQAVQIAAVILSCVGGMTAVVWNASGEAREVKIEIQAEKIKSEDKEKRIRQLETNVADMRGDIKVIRAILEGNKKP